jgi:hypothetical protein
MASLVTQAQALAQLRLIEAALTPDQLADVNFKAEQASALICDYLKVPFIEGPITPEPTTLTDARQAGTLGWDDFPPMVIPPWLWDRPLTPSVPPIPPDPWTPANVPTLVKGVILIVLTSLYDGRTPEDALLSQPVVDALARLRDPALA